MKGWRLVVAAAAVSLGLAVPGVARAEEYPESAGWGVLAVFANLGYMPVKTVYALFGGLTGGLAYVCTAGSYDTASTIWEMSLGGTYVLTPAMIRGEEAIAFAGPAGEPAVADTAAPSNHSLREESLPAS
jgi:hypothetical protein